MGDAVQRDRDFIVSGRLSEPEIPHRLNRRIVSTIVLVALIITSVSIRLLYLVYSGLPLQLSGAEMERAAANLAREGSIGRIYSDQTGSSAHVSPLYPLLLGALYRVFGWNTIAGRWVQEICAIAATTVGFTLLPVVARKSGAFAAAGWTAAFTLAILPMNLWIETSGSWEQPYSALALSGLILLFCRLGDGGWKVTTILVLVGGYTGLVALLSPTLLPAVALMIAGEFLIRKEYRGRVAIGSLAIGVTAGLVIAPWAIRNTYAFGGFVPLRSNLAGVGDRKQPPGERKIVRYILG